MTTWADLQPLVRAPALTLSTRVVFEGDNFDPNPLRTGKGPTAYRYIHFETSIPGSDYLTFSGSSGRLIFGIIEATIYGEPAGSSKGIYEIADELEAAYDGQNSDTLTFDLSLATMPQDLFTENDWLRLDWRLPFRWFKNDD